MNIIIKGTSPFKPDMWNVLVATGQAPTEIMVYWQGRYKPSAYKMVRQASRSAVFKHAALVPPGHTEAEAIDLFERAIALKAQLEGNQRDS